MWRKGGEKETATSRTTCVRTGKFTVRNVVVV